jgi:UDP-N-acetyl-D-mannosaminuronate dehydrogenase
MTATQAPKHHGAAERLQELIDTNRAVVGVIGLGYVGLPLAHALHQGGLPVVGFDIDRRKIDAIKAGNEKLLNFLTGKVMKSATTKPNPKQVTELLRARLL